MLIVRGLISFVVVGIAVILQVTIVDRIAFPGGTGPDVVLLAVAALALAGGPLAGALIGFFGGLALDVAPPGSHLVGENALVFCLIGYLCGLVADIPSRDGAPEQGHTALFEIAVTAAGAVCGEALTAGLGKMLSDPRISVPAIRHVLPVAVIYDVLLCPFVLYAVAAALRLAGMPRSQRDRVAWATPAARSPVGTTQGAIRQVNGGTTPRLRLSERGKGEGLGRGPLAPAPAKREPRLKLGHAGSLGAAYAASGSRRGPGVSSGTMAGALGGASKVKFAARRGEGAFGGSMLGGAMALNSNLSRSRLNSSRFGRSRMGRSLLGGSVFSRSPSALRSSPPPRKAPIGRSSFLGRSPFLGRSSFLGRSPALGRSSFLGRSPALGRSSASARTSSLGRTSGLGRSVTSRRTAGRMRSLGGSATPYAPRASRPGPLARLAGAWRRSFRRQPRLRQRRTVFRQPFRTKAPGRGWLRRSSAGLGSTRLHMQRPKGPGAKKRWRTGGYR
jgi:rod shape-determining protein MreD